MKKRWMAVPAGFFSVWLVSCDISRVESDPRFSLPDDPPSILAIRGRGDTGALVRVAFPPYSMDTTVQETGSTFRRSASLKPGPRLAPIEIERLPVLQFVLAAVFIQTVLTNRVGFEKPDEAKLASRFAIDPESIYLTSRESGSVHVVNGRTGSSGATIRVGTSPAGIALSADRTQALVANSGSASVSIVDLNTNSVAGTVALPPGTTPMGIDVSRETGNAYVTDFAQQFAAVYVVNPGSRAVVGKVDVGNYPARVAVSPDGLLVYVTSVFEDTVFVVDAVTNTLAGRITGIPNAYGVAFNPAGTKAYVVSYSDASGSLKVVDVGTNAVTASIPVGNAPTEVLVSPSGRYVFVLHQSSTYITQIDTATNLVVRNIDIGGQGLAMTFAPVGRP